MAICPQCSDFLKPDATTCPECGWTSALPTRPRSIPPPPNSSPRTPVFHDEPWRSLPPPPDLPPDVHQALQQLKARLEGPMRTQPLDETHVTQTEITARYLAACRAKGYNPDVLDAVQPAPNLAPPGPHRLTPARAAWRALLKRTFPVEEWESKSKS